MMKQTSGICLVVQKSIEGRTPHDRVQAERPEKIETPIQVRAA